MLKTPKTICNLFNVTDKTPQLLRCKVVDKVSCSDCNGFYVWKTYRNLITRIEEHKIGTMHWEKIEILDHMLYISWVI